MQEFNEVNSKVFTSLNLNCSWGEGPNWSIWPNSHGLEFGGNIGCIADRIERAGGTFPNHELTIPTDRG